MRIPEPDTRGPEVEARFLNLQRQALEALELLPQAPPELHAAVQSVTSAAALADLATAYMDVKPEEKQEILETIDVTARVDKVSRMLAERIEVLRLSHEIGRQTKKPLSMSGSAKCSCASSWRPSGASSERAMRAKRRK